MRTTGTSRVTGSALIARQTVMPSITGMSMSNSTTSGSGASTKSSAFVASSSTSKTRRGFLPRGRGPEPRDHPLAIDRLHEMLVGAEWPRQALVVLDRHHDDGHVVAERADGLQDRL